jgi:hypothetical protein
VNFAEPQSTKDLKMRNTWKRNSLLTLAAFAFIWSVSWSSIEASSRKPQTAPTAQAVAKDTMTFAPMKISAPIPFVQADDPAPITGLAKTTVDGLAGTGVGRDAAIIILAIIMIALYRFLQWAAGKSKTPVGTLGLNMLAKIISLLFGSEAVWKNRFVVSAADYKVDAQMRSQLVERLRKDYPIIAHYLPKKGDQVTSKKS